MPQAVPCPAKPPAGLGRPPIQPGGRALPQLLHGVIKVQHAPCMAREALLKEAPQPAATVAEPNHVGGMHDALAHGFAPQPGTERLDVPQDGHETAVLQPCVTTWPSRVRCWPRRASTPTLMSRQRMFPVGAPPVGRNGTITPS